ncbi:MAG: YqiA/YcfP family alpha/beta fold hydrolase [Pseudanabaenaceae cyanobacterium SKYGB_i_bin29]|nr:alpha/beta fold hydrolase [Pseudanabaenaceae cyanobacterium SKYG29]MDW8420604.1 YqiA/YcfP family alpha/beta fold hydrolase [Pseudanabaenaceae cyanobacterium SKYGB_i_bin29]
MVHYIYLHGFGSSAQSHKASYLTDRFQERGLNLLTPDLNLGDFTTITLSKQLAFLQANYGDTPCYVMGSSLGGLLATLWASRATNVKSLILLAPAFRFGECLQQMLGNEEMANWRSRGRRNFYHYGLGRELPLHYEFFVDACQQEENSLQRELPILIIHGKYDDVVLPQRSMEFAQGRPSVTVRLVADDHSLANVLDYIWAETQNFWQL